MGLRAVIPGYINYRYQDGAIPGHTKASFKEYGILTIHSIIVKNALILMHKIKQFSTQLPESVKNLMPDNIPHIESTHETSSDWLQIYGTQYFNTSVFFKGPLLYISQLNLNATSLKSLFSLNIYKSDVKKALLEQQSSGDNSDWPSFLLHSIPGLRKSTRTANATNNNDPELRNQL